MIIEIKYLQEFEEYDFLIKSSVNGTIFHTKKYLQIKGVSKILCICKGEKIVSLCALHEYEKNKYEQFPIEIPYGGLVFLEEIKCRKDFEQQRKCYDLLIEYLQKNYDKVDFSMTLYNRDIFSFIEKKFIPEIRYTYVVDLNKELEIILGQMSKNRRRDYKKSLKENLIVDMQSSDKEKKKILFWVEDDGLRDRLLMEMEVLIESNQGVIFNVRNENLQIIGQLFLCWDWRSAYVQNVYVDRQYAHLGISTRLYIEALKYAKEILSLELFDFNGSVLSGIEKYYRTFGGKQELYFNLHWNRDYKDLLNTDYYDYR